VTTEPLDRLEFVGLGVWSFESLGPDAPRFPLDLGSGALSLPDRRLELPDDGIEALREFL
jgi:hypothetical protein